MTDDPYRPYTPTAVMPPDATPEVPNAPTDALAKPFALPNDFPATPRPAGDAPPQTPDAVPQPTDVAPSPGDAPVAPGRPGDAAPHPTDATTLPPEVMPPTTDAPSDRLVSLDVPMGVMDLGDGKPVEVIGDVTRLKDLLTQQGDNPYGVKGDCGVVSCRNILMQFGIDASETSVLKYAMDHGLCRLPTEGVAPEDCGGTSPLQQCQILNGNGVPAHAWVDQTPEDLAGFVQTGRGVIINVNAGILWNDPQYLDNPDKFNHAISVIGVERDPTTHALTGFIVNDTGNDKTERISVEQMNGCFVRQGGILVATDNAVPHR